MKSNQKHVRVYDFETEEEFTIPSAELAPGMIAIRIQGRDGIYWTDSKKLKGVQHGPLRHPPFDTGRRKQIKAIMKALKEVRPLTFKQWEDGFRRDMHAETEINYWSHLAGVYSTTVRQNALNFTQRKTLFHVLVTCLATGYEMVWEVLDHEGLSSDIARAAVEEFYGHPALKAEFRKVNPEDYRDENGIVPVPITAFEDDEARDVLRAAEIIIAVDCSTKAPSVFFGRDKLRRIVGSGKAETVNFLLVLFDARTDHLEYLSALVEQLKGSCCYGQH